ncbi:xanthine/uracil permase YicO [Escherichia coli]|nr:xanthine/uracil permase YicO [Escherichia coli]
MIYRIGACVYYHGDDALTFSITEGIALGFMSYCIMKVCTGRWRDLNLCVVVVAALFALKIILVD